jgi:hypothetical protein
MQGASTNPPAQTVVFTSWGNCAWPVTWTTSLAHRTPWLTLTPASGTVKGNGQSGSLVVNATIAGLAAGTYSTQVTVTASDASGATMQGSPQTFAVTLTVLPPCVLAPASPASLAFTVPQGQSTAPSQTVAMSETGTCSRPVTWTASTGNSAWLALSATSGSDPGSGSTFGVSIAAASLLPGTYTGTITLAATDSTGASVGSQTVSVSLTVTSYTVSGTVFACPNSTPPNCTTPQALPGATLTLTGGSTTLNATADGAGNYSIAGVPLGSYTLTASGTDANGGHYVGTVTVSVAGNTANVTVQVFPG